MKVSIPLILFCFAFSFLNAQDEGCNTFELLPPLVDGQLSTDSPPMPCGFFAPSGAYINQCSPCGNKVLDDDCVSTPSSPMCAIDGFQSTLEGYSNDLNSPTLGFCGGGTGTHNNAWIGFTAQTERVELLITAFNCTSQNNSRGIQLAIAETDCQDVYRTLAEGNALACFGAAAQGGLFNSAIILESNELVPGNPYYILIDGFAGGVCDFRIDVLDGFGLPEYNIVVSSPGVLCPDILNPGEFTSQFGSGAIVDVEVGGVASTDLTYFWLNPSDEVIATTQGEVITPNFVRGTLDGSFFTESGTYSVQIFDNGSCCPLCTEVELTIADPPPAAAAVLVGANGEAELNCENEEIVIEGGPSDGSSPAVEQWQIVDENGDRVQLDIHLVAQDGRLNEITLTREDVENILPGQLSGTIIIVYGFLTNFTDLCFSDAAVEIPFDFITNCDPSSDCEITISDADFNCSIDSIFFDLNYSANNLSSQAELFINGSFAQNIPEGSNQNISVSIERSQQVPDYTFLIRDQNNPACADQIQINNLMCPNVNTECIIEGLEIEETDCNGNGTFNLTINYEIENNSSELIDVSLNGNIVGTFEIEDALIIDDIVPSGNSNNSLTLCENGTGTSCCQTINFQEPNCLITDSSCDNVANFNFLEIDCSNDQEYLLLIDFDFQGTSPEEFEITINNNEITSINTNQLPFLISGLSSNGNSNDETISICFEGPVEGCCLDFQYEAPSCLFNAVDQSLVENVIIQPNPTKYNLLIDNIPTEVEGIIIYDNVGKIMSSHITEESILLDVHDLVAGVYVIQFYTKDSRFMSKRFIKMD